MVRVVVDTNVLVSALVAGGKPRKLVVELLQKHTVVLSRQVLVEVADVLARDKFNVKNTQIDRFLAILTRKSRLIKTQSCFKVIAEDPDDDVVLNTAYSGKADYIVTGDKHLLALGKFKRTEIVNVTQLLSILTTLKRD